MVLASKPVFGPIRDKLGVITRAFFAQRDFENTDILGDFYTSFQHALKDEDQTSEAAIYMSISLREFVHRFRMQTLSLLKLLLLQRKVRVASVDCRKLAEMSLHGPSLGDVLWSASGEIGLLPVCAHIASAPLVTSLALRPACRY